MTTTQNKREWWLELWLADSSKATPIKHILEDIVLESTRRGVQGERERIIGFIDKAVVDISEMSRDEPSEEARTSFRGELMALSDLKKRLCDI